MSMLDFLFQKSLGTFSIACFFFLFFFKAFPSILLLLLPVPYNGQAKNHFIDSIFKVCQAQFGLKLLAKNKQTKKQTNNKKKKSQDAVKVAGSYQTFPTEIGVCVLYVT